MNRMVTKFKRRSQSGGLRQGYVLVMCLLVVAISSAIVLSLFEMLRIQTAEAMARRQQMVLASLNEAAAEHAIAILTDQPNFRGNLGPIQRPSQANQTYTVQISEVGGAIQLSTFGAMGGATLATSKSFDFDLLLQRRKALGLAAFPIKDKGKPEKPPKDKKKVRKVEFSSKSSN